MSKKRRPSMGATRQTIGADEYDAFTGWKRFYRWRAGDIASLKRRSNKRERKLSDERIRKGET